MITFDLPNPETLDLIIDKMFTKGLLAIKSRDCSIHFRGMLNTPEEVMDKSLGIIAQIIPAVY